MYGKDEYHETRAQEIIDAMQAMIDEAEPEVVLLLRFQAHAALREMGISPPLFMPTEIGAERFQARINVVERIKKGGHGSGFLNGAVGLLRFGR